jgi:hypothetical protein
MSVGLVFLFPKALRLNAGLRDETPRRVATIELRRIPCSRELGESPCHQAEVSRVIDALIVFGCFKHVSGSCLLAICDWYELTTD